MKKTIIVYSVLTILLLLTFKKFKEVSPPKQPIENIDTMNVQMYANSIMLDEVVVIGYRKNNKVDTVKVDSVNKK
jgi:hypothetical protein